MRAFALSVLIVLVLLPGRLIAADWPAWRFDAARRAVTPEELPPTLHLSWWRDFPQNHVAWQEDPRLQFDACFQPVVAGGTMIVASSSTDSVSAIDVETGSLRWKFYTDGPIRLAPFAHESKVYFGADDGYFYCLDANRGELDWKFNAAPADRLVLGNERLISVWPIRGGAVIANGKLYFTAGVWPFEGTLLYTVDLQRSRGEVPRYTVTTLQDISPQGHLVVNHDRLYIPGGRAKATCIDLKTGDVRALAYNSPGLTDHHVTSSGDLLFHGDKAYHTRLERMMLFSAQRPVSDGKKVYAGAQQIIEEQPATAAGKTARVVHKIVAFDLENSTTISTQDRRGEEVQREQVPVAWEMAADSIVASTEPVVVHLKAGGQLYGSRGGFVFALNPGGADHQPGVNWIAEVEGTPASMLVADKRLFVVTREGRIYCFSGEAAEPQTHPLAIMPRQRISSRAEIGVDPVLHQVADRAGYCVVLGGEESELISELVLHSQLRIIVFDSEPQRVDQLRWKYDAQGLYGNRIAALAREWKTTRLPPYLASLIIAGTSGLVDESSTVAESFEMLRPYGGVLALKTDDPHDVDVAKRIEPGDLYRAELSREEGWTYVKRTGALDGAADWTHEYGNAANTLMSADERVRAPLGVLWFGGPAGSGELYFNRHYWGPGLTVVDGRMFVQGPERLAAIDIYTGRVLWKIELPAGSGLGRRGNFFEVHKPGFHFVAVPDSVYLVYPGVCLRLDPATGETLAELHLPAELDEWGKVRVWKDRLIVTVFRASVPSAVAAIDRYNGQIVWTKQALQSIPLVSVGGDRVFYFDAAMEGFYDAWARRGLVPTSSPDRYIKALDAETGEELWQRTSELVATWLAYSAEHDVVVLSNKTGVEALIGKSGDALWKQNEDVPGFGGHPENVWDKVIISGDLVIDQRGPGRAYHLQTGEPLEDTHPLTGKTVTWQFTKTGHHCNYAIASPHLLTFRAATAGFFDRHSKGTARLTGFRSGCRNSLIPAGGVLNAPNYAHGCVCSYNLFTSLALVHVPEADLWTYNAYEMPKQEAAKRVGINFGAPGARMSASGTLWLEHPRGKDPSVSVAVEVAGEDLRWFRQHSTQVAASQLRWVGASGVEGLSSILLEVPGDSKIERGYSVRMYFSEPNDIAPGERVFDVWLQGERVLEDLDICRVAGGPQRLFEKTVSGIRAESQFRIDFAASQSEPLICGVEIVQE